MPAKVIHGHSIEIELGPLQFEIDEQLNTTWYKE